MTRSMMFYTIFGRWPRSGNAHKCTPLTFTKVRCPTYTPTSNTQNQNPPCQNTLCQYLQFLVFDFGLKQVIIVPVAEIHEKCLCFRV
eukprot:3387025-Rhodomonas_salina.2